MTDEQTELLKQIFAELREIKKAIVEESESIQSAIATYNI
jgi:hypothetical protein